MCACVVVPWGLRGRAGELTARGHVAAFGQCGGDSPAGFYRLDGLLANNVPDKENEESSREN
jgi:hypothetical protein